MISKRLLILLAPLMASPAFAAGGVRAIDGSGTDDEDPGIRSFSGIVTYTKQFQVDEKLLQDSPRIELDLGEVREVARVFLNGEEVGISSFAPHVLDITRQIRQGENSLTIEVANTWLNRLIADDAPSFARIAPDILNGSCPSLLDGFLEVRGLGILNIRAMFGDSAIKLNKYLRLIVNLERQDRLQLAELDRLAGSNSSRWLLGVEIPEITLPVAPGRSLAILVEAAVRNHQLRR